jgi:signal transduction histidine kinase
LVDAIQWQAQEFSRRTDVKTTFSALPEDFSLDRERSTALFRICQEALTNIVRHAEATSVKISLNKTRSRVVLKISDNGIGIHEDRILDPKAFGLAGMRERAGFLAGEVRISSVPGKGTVLAVRIPLPRREESDAEDTDRR